MSRKTEEGRLKQGIIDTFGYYPIWYVSIAPAFVRCPQCGHGFARHGIRPGVPDILVCYQGMFFGIEAKVGRNDLSGPQIEQKLLIENAGGTVIVARDTYDVIDGLKLRRLL